MLNQSQVNQVAERLVLTGSVSRNWCLRRYITRLGAIINDLVKAGWKFDDYAVGDVIMRGRWEKDKHGKRTGDYVYYLVSQPKKNG